MKEKKKEGEIKIKREGEREGEGEKKRSWSRRRRRSMLTAQATVPYLPGPSQPPDAEGSVQSGRNISRYISTTS